MEFDDTQHPRSRYRTTDRSPWRRRQGRGPSPPRCRGGDIAPLSRLASHFRLLRHGDVLLGFRLLRPWHLSRRARRLNDWPAALISGATTAYYLFSALLVVFVSDVIARL